MIVQGGDVDTINAGLQTNKGAVYTVPAGVYIITSMFTLTEGTTLQGTVGPNGELLTTLKIADNQNWGLFIPMITAKSNTRILNINFDGNSMNQHTVPTKDGKNWGQGSHNFIKIEYGNGIEVAYCNFYNNLGDGLRAINSANIKFHHNTASKGGHDVCFIIRSEGAWIHHNNLQPRSNSAIRLMDVKHVRIYNNVVTYVNQYDGVRYDAGPATQIQQDSGEMVDIEVCGNVITNSCGPGLWLVGKTGAHDELWLHDNVFKGCSINDDLSWDGGIIASGYDNALIEKNVFDGSYRAGVCFFAVSNSWTTSATATIQNNIFTNTKKGLHGGEGGAGIENSILPQIVNSNANIFWNNAEGNTKGRVSDVGSIEADPKTAVTTSGFIWTEQGWQGPQINPREMGDIPVGPDGNNSYSGLDPITEEDIQEFDNIFDILNVKFLEQAINSNSTPIDEIEENTKGVITGGVDIAGYNKMVKIDGEYYISSPNDAIIISKAENVASRPVSIKKEITLTPGDGVLTADMKVRASYKVAVKHHKTVLRIPVTTIEYVQKNQTQAFNCTKPMPLIFNESEAGTVNIKIMNQTANPQTRVYAYSNIDTVKIGFEYNGSQSYYVQRVGIVEKSPNNVEYVNMTKAEYWENVNVTGRVGNTFVIPKALNPQNAADQIIVTYYDVYGNEQEAEKYNITEITSTGDLKGYFNPILIMLIIIFGTFSYASVKNFQIFRRRW